MSIYIDLKDNGLEKVYYNYIQYPSYIHYNFLSEYPNYAVPPHYFNISSIEYRHNFAFEK